MKYVNVQQELERVKHLLESRDVDTASQKEIRHIAERIEEYAKTVLKHRRDEINEDDQRTLQWSINAFSKLSNAEPGAMPDLYEKGLEKLRTYFNSVVYLTRHPEKPALDPREAKKNKRTLSREGVKETYRFAEALTELLLLCPQNVQLHLYHSDKNRTYLVTKYIKKRVSKLANKYDKDFMIDGPTKHKSLFIRFQDEHLEEMEDDDTDESLVKWLRGEYSDNLPDPEVISGELSAFIQENLVSSQDTWHVTLGVSHSFCIDSFIWNNGGEKLVEGIIDTMDYVKAQSQGWGKQYCYKGRWMNFN